MFLLGLVTNLIFSGHVVARIFRIHHAHPFLLKWCMMTASDVKPVELNDDGDTAEIMAEAARVDLLFQKYPPYIFYHLTGTRPLSSPSSEGLITESCSSPAQL